MLSGIDFSVFKHPKSDLIKKFLLSFLGVVFIGFSIAFNSYTNLGTDPISVFSDGVHRFLKISLGSACDVTNGILFLVILFLGRRYMNIGTLIHAILLGFFVNLGTYLYSLLNISNTIFFRAVMAVIACFLLFFGTALLIAVDVGLDVWTGLAMIFRDRTHKEYKFFRVAIDIFSMVAGYLLGGQVGAVTVLVAFFGGPAIQALVKFIKKSVFVLVKLENRV